MRMRKIERQVYENRYNNDNKPYRICGTGRNAYCEFLYKVAELDGRIYEIWATSPEDAYRKIISGKIASRT